MRGDPCQLKDPCHNIIAPTSRLSSAYWTRTNSHTLWYILTLFKILLYTIMLSYHHRICRTYRLSLCWNIWVWELSTLGSQGIYIQFTYLRFHPRFTKEFSVCDNSSRLKILPNATYSIHRIWCIAQYQLFIRYFCQNQTKSLTLLKWNCTTRRKILNKSRIEYNNLVWYLS